MIAADIKPQEDSRSRAQAPLTLTVYPGGQLAGSVPLTVEDGRSADADGAVICNISSAPSLRARQNHPAYRARLVDNQSVTQSPVLPQKKSIPVLIGKTLAYMVALVLVVVGGFAIGTSLQPQEYVGDVRTHSVSSGDTLHQLAGKINTDRPLDDVVEDIRVLNHLASDLLVHGQTLVLPVE